MSAGVFLLATLVAHSQNSSDGWPAYGGTNAGQRYSTAKQITKDNVAQLKPAWTVHTHVFDQASVSNWRASTETTPILFEDTLYFTTPFDTVFAVAADTGKVRWTFDPQIDRTRNIYIVTSRGVSLWLPSKQTPGLCGAGAIVLATEDRRLMELDARTGKPCLQFGNGGQVNLLDGLDVANTIYLDYTSAPAVVGDMIVLGSTVADNQKTFVASGAVRGFNAGDGKQVWAWEPIRDRQKLGEANVGSGNAWSTISADAEHDLVFVPTGSPSLDFYGGTRPGDNRDANSIVALRASTGERVWAFQLVHHDLWDYDTPSEPLLFTFRGTTPAVAVTGKTGMVYVFNRLTGEPLYPITERKVARSQVIGERAAATQPFSSLPPLTPLSFTADDLKMSNPADQAFCVDQLKSYNNYGIFTPPSTRGTVIFPGDLGGSNWGSSAFDPATGILYTRVTNLAYVVQQTSRKLSHIEDRNGYIRHQIGKLLPESLGGDGPPIRGTDLAPDSGANPDAQEELGSQVGTSYVLARKAFLAPSGEPCAPQPYGSIVALNLNTGEKAWTVAHGKMNGGGIGSIGAAGVIATAGGLLFVGSSNDSLMRAYDSANGNLLWTAPLPAPANATPMTYTSHGRQYVVIAAGGHGFIGTGKSDTVVAFALPLPPARRNRAVVR